jgi:hypothetical protein
MARMRSQVSARKVFRRPARRGRGRVAAHKAPAAAGTIAAAEIMRGRRDKLRQQCLKKRKDRADAARSAR